MRKPLRIGLVASETLRAGAASPLVRLLRAVQPMLAGSFQTHLAMPGGTFDAVARSGVIDDTGITVERLRPVREGGLITLTARIVGGNLAPGELDWIVYLLDPLDPAALYPETQALKRQCVVNDKPFLSTESGASAWFALAWSAALGTTPQPPALQALLARWVRPDELGSETLGLIAHDRLKPDMLAFAARHRAVLSRFGRRLATGTTGALLNGTVPHRLAHQAGQFTGTLANTAPETWVQAVRSGPLGGDAEIAEEVLESRCRQVIFFEDPHVAREHESDIQLLERATRFSPAGCLCINSPGVADLWADNLAALLEAEPT